jgi:hypothetical protein
MNEIIETLTVFLNIMRDDILEYYQKSYSYLKDLIEYKKINLNKKIETENEKQIKNTLAKILKAVRTGLNTIGIPVEKLNENQMNFLDELSKNKDVFIDYNSYIESYLKNYVNRDLFNILIEYLLDIDIKKLENVNLFDLLPQYFVSKLNEFKKSHFRNHKVLEIFKQQDYLKYINFEDLTVLKDKKVLEVDILTQLREAKEEIIETLKTPKKELLKQSVETIEDVSISEEKTPQARKVPPSKDQDFSIILNTRTFIDYFGNFSPIQPEIINKFKIDKLNLVNTKLVDRDFFDLENLFYYVSIFKMLNLELPFSSIEILDILKNYVNSWIFSSSKDNIPDSISNFYGLAIFLELELLNKTDLIDLHEIESFIKSDLEEFIPERLTSNLYSILCLKLITKIQNKPLKLKFKFDPFFDLNILETENFKPTLDIYNYLVTLKLIKNESFVSKLKIPLAYEIKQLITSNGSISDLITESARALLIFDLLDLKDSELELCRNLLNFILDKTSVFFIDNIDKDFNWRNDKFGFKIELEILYWALLASYQFTAMFS